MNRSTLYGLFDNMTPAPGQKERMKRRILEAAGSEKEGRVMVPRRRAWLALPAACFALALTLLTVLPLGANGMAFSVSALDSETRTALKLMDNGSTPEDCGAAVVNVDPRPGLEFWIEGRNIAKIEVSCETEYLLLPNAVEWSVDCGGNDTRPSADPDHPYDRSFTLLPGGTSGEQFVTLRWEALNLFDWASEDDYAHIKGANVQPAEEMSEEEKLALAAGQAGPGIGHIQLAGYSPELLEDRITITLTDREGGVVTKVIRLALSNNESGETVVTAGVENP